MEIIISSQIIFNYVANFYFYFLIIFFIINVILIIIFILSNESFCFRMFCFSLMYGIIHVLFGSLTFIAISFVLIVILLKFTSHLLITQALLFQCFLLEIHMLWISFCSDFYICLRLFPYQDCSLYKSLIQVYQFNYDFYLIFFYQLKIS